LAAMILQYVTQMELNQLADSKASLDTRTTSSDARYSQHMDMPIYPLTKDLNQGLRRLGTNIGFFHAIAVANADNDKVGLRLMNGTLEIGRRTSISLDDAMAELFDFLVEFRGIATKGENLWSAIRGLGGELLDETGSSTSRSTNDEDCLIGFHLFVCLLVGWLS
jgi:hypothetical protein